MSWQQHQELRWFVPEIELAGHLAGLDLGLVGAVCLTESNGFTQAYRYEPLFYKRYNLASKYPGQNPRRISASYGLMQIMYPTAHELGHEGLPELLFQPQHGLKYGCLHLRRCLDWAAQFTTNEKERLVSGLAAYNGGRSSAQKPPSPLNMAYALRVLRNMEQLG